MQFVENPERIRIPKVAEVVANTLRRKIVTGEYEIGELLPPEGSLMSTFDVARTTIRDAFRILETEGLLEVRRGGGGGGRVRAPSTAMVADYAALLLQFEHTTVEDVHIGRTLIEAPAAGLLARSADEAALASLRALLEDEASASDEASLIKAEGRFHRAVVDLAGNRVVSLLSAVAGRLIAEQITRARGRAAPVEPSDGRVATDPAYAKAHRAHVRLVALIEAGDHVAAEALWRRHLDAGTAELAQRPRAARSVLDLLP